MNLAIIINIDDLARIFMLTFCCIHYILLKYSSYLLIIFLKSTLFV